MKKTFRIENGELILQSIQIPLVNHCVNNCIACASFSPVSDKGFLDKEIIKRDMLAMGKLVKIDIFYLFGGEALLHPNLIEIMDIVREIGIAKKITITTNGQLLNKMGKDFWDRIDDVNLTRYPGKLTDQEYWDLVKKTKDLGKNFNHVDPHFAKIIVSKKLNNNDAQKVFDKCEPGGWCLTVYNGWFYLCCQFFYLRKFLMKDLNDGIQIKDLTKDRLIEYLNMKKAPESCSWCTGLLDRKQIGWKESINKEEWWRESTASGI